jgi:hypothetical protein
MDFRSWRLRRYASLLVLAAAGAAPAHTASAAPEAVAIEIDKSGAGSAPAGEMAGRIDQLGKGGIVCLDLKVRLDDGSRGAVRRSSEESDPGSPRELVACGPASSGPLAMGPGLEYYVVTQGSGGNRIDLSIYPGSRTAHVANDAACVLSDDDKGALFRVRGLYVSRVNRYADVGEDGKPNGKAIVAIQLRPIAGSAEEAAACAK